MKKQILMVSALVIVALSSMLVACDKKDDKNGASDSGSDKIEGCTCTYNGVEPVYLSLSEMKEEYGVSTCSALQREMRDEYDTNAIECK